MTIPTNPTPSTHSPSTVKGGYDGLELLVFDNYDSFTYNLVHLVEKITHQKVVVFRNDEIALEDVAKYHKIILSPGPGIPEEAGLLLPLIHQYAPSKAILGVCLGHQAIGQSFGGKLTNLSKVYHGIATPIEVIPPTTPETERALFKGLGNPLLVGRYHSWVVRHEDFPDELTITAQDELGHIMALEHKTYNVRGVQFHPESILTPDGETIVRNWLDNY